MPANAMPANAMPANTIPGNTLPNDALAALKPLIEPAKISAWPPAPGWWAVGVILLCVILAAAVWAFRRWRFLQRTRYQREALQLLSAIADTVASDTGNHHIDNHDTEKHLHDVAMILRRAVICAWGREHAATLSWQAIFAEHATRNNNLKNNRNNAITIDHDSEQLLTQSLYRQQAPSRAELQHLITQVSAWLVTLPPVED